MTFVTGRLNRNKEKDKFDKDKEPLQEINKCPIPIRKNPFFSVRAVSKDSSENNPLPLSESEGSPTNMSKKKRASLKIKRQSSPATPRQRRSGGGNSNAFRKRMIRNSLNRRQQRGPDSALTNCTITTPSNSCDDSIVILSPSPASGSGYAVDFSASETPASASSGSRGTTPGLSLCSETGDSGIGVVQQYRGRKTTASSSKGTASDDSIVILDDFDDEEQLRLTRPQSEDADIICLSDANSVNIVRGSSVSTPKEEDCEIIAVKLVTPTTAGKKSNKRRSLQASGSGAKGAGRKGSTNISFSSLKMAMDRARRRLSNGTSSLARTSVLSHAITKKKTHANRRNQRRDSFGFRTPVAMRKRTAFQPLRRPSSPIFLLGHELGPANPNYRHPHHAMNSWSRPQPQRHQPSSSFRNNSGRSPRDFFNPRPTFPSPPVASNQEPKEPNFLSTANENQAPLPGTLRPIVIDGSNVAMGHGNSRVYSCQGIKICTDYFKNRGHEVTVFVPQFRRRQMESVDTHILDDLEREGIVKFTPSREVGGFRIASYDDRFIIQYAHLKGAVIVSNDNFRDIYMENEEWRDTIRYRLLQFTWLERDNTMIMFPDDPLGRNGLKLDEFLRF